MKKFFTLLSIVGIVTACKQSPPATVGAESNTSVSAEQAAEFAAFQEWKTQKEDIANLREPVKETKTTVIYVPQKQAPVRTVVQKVPVQQTATVSEAPPAIPQKEETKKGWSKAAKGAVIGAGAGAVTGAVVAKKNRGLGAVIGAVAGGGVGFGIGKVLDKKDRGK